MDLEKPQLAQLERALEEALERHGSAKRSPSNLNESIRYSLLSPGKRIRPRLMLATAQTIGQNPEHLLWPAISLEMVHCFTLIHDDLPCMDDDDLRRGLPTNHKKFGEALALLAGDALIPMAVSTFLDARTHFKAEHFMNGLQRFLDVSGAPGVIGGQAAELLLREGSSLDELKNVFAGKTGALFVASIMIPADLAGIAPDSPQGKSLLTFAQELGLGFQVADDLEDPESAWEPDHILYYLSRVEAAQLSSRGLRSSTESLQRTWGENASALVRISNEVQAKLAAGSGA